MQDRQAVLEWLMSQYGTALLRMCCLYLRDYSLAEDAVQETFLKAYVCQRTNGQRIWSLTWYIPASVSGNEFCVAVTLDALTEEILSCDAVTGGIGKKTYRQGAEGKNFSALFLSKKHIGSV